MASSDEKILEIYNRLHKMARKHCRTRAFPLSWADDLASDEFQKIAPSLAKGKDLDAEESFKAISRAAERRNKLESTSQSLDDGLPGDIATAAASSLEAKESQKKEAIENLLPASPWQKYYAEFRTDHSRNQAEKLARERFLQGLRDLFNGKDPKVSAALDEKLRRAFVPEAFSDYVPKPGPERYSNGRRKDGHAVGWHKHRGRRLLADENEVEQIALDESTQKVNEDYTREIYEALLIKNKKMRLLAREKVDKKFESIFFDLDMRCEALAKKRGQAFLMKASQAYDGALESQTPAPVEPKSKNKHARRSRRSQRPT